MVTSEFVECPNCGHSPLEPRKRVEDNEVEVSGHYCPGCGNEYDEDAVLGWKYVDFPLWISWESYSDSWEMLRKVREAVNIHPDAQDSIPADDMKYTVFSVYFKVLQSGEVEGPFAERGDEETIYE